MKKKSSSVKAISLATSMLLALAFISPNTTSAATSNLQTSKEKVSSRLLKEFQDDEKITFLIKFKEKSASKKVAAEARKIAKENKFSAKKTEIAQRSAVVSDLKATSHDSQEKVKQYLKEEEKKGNVTDIESFFIVNGIAVTATKEVAEKVANFDEVESVLPDETRQLYTTKTNTQLTNGKLLQLPLTSNTKKAPDGQVQATNIEWNVERVKAPEAWNVGINGSGIVVATIDTGVQWDHPALKAKYRGYNASTGAVSHSYNWYDATKAGKATPYDDVDHGTHVMGTMVGSESNGTNQIGVAPGAKFIAVKAFTRNGGSDTALLKAAQWILAPTDSKGNARVDMAPDIVNNSWGGGPGLDEWYRDVVINWRAADIFPEFSAGNTTTSNPGGPGSVATPANYPESFATGAIDSNNKVASFSLRGPSPYGEIKPDISAPGVNIRSSVPGGVYEGGWNGTSMAGPAVSGVAALLKQANPNLSVDEMEQILITTATPLTDSTYPQTPNNGYGYGLVDAYKAITSVNSGLGTLANQVQTKEKSKKVLVNN
nr:S8 family serine peptidase [Rummeliibacillus pycnus]